MRFLVEKSSIKGTTKVPASKSHTIRAVFTASLAKGTSEINNPLPSWDCFSAVEICKLLGAEIITEENKWIVKGTSGELLIPNDVLNAGNSGTTMYITTAVASLLPKGYAVLTGDYQLRRRPIEPLIKSLNTLGANIFSTRENGLLPLVIKGKLKGGKTSLPGINSQWLTGLLIASPLAKDDIEIYVENLHEIPYIDMTLSWLKRCGVKYEHEDYKVFKVLGNQQYNSFNVSIPSDWESACFILGAAAICGEEVTVYGLDMRDPQGDKAIINILKEMGADIVVKNYGIDGIHIRGGKTLRGIKVDCKNLPDIPPILAVLGTQAEGETILYNLGASHLKETDRPKTITEELVKMGANIEYDGEVLKIRKSKLYGTKIFGHHDHRIVMATAVAGMVAEGITLIETAEYAAVSFPNFYDVFKNLGANIEKLP